jgi:hypothetical protein
MNRISVFSTLAFISAFALIFALSEGLSSRAFAQEGTPASEMATDQGILMTTSVARDQLPADEGFVLIGRVTFEPGAHQTCGCSGEHGSVITFVDSGPFTFELERGGRIIRGANTATPHEEVAAPATRFTLAAGDAMIFPGKKRYEANETSEPATYLFALILAPTAPPEPDPTDVGVRTTEILGVVPGAWAGLQADPVTVTLSRASLDAGSSVPVPAGGMLAVVSSIAQDPATPTALVAGGDRATTNSGATAMDVFVLSFEPASVATPTA